MQTKLCIYITFCHGAGINTFAVLRKRCISPCIVYTLKIDKKIRYRHLIKTLDFNTHFYTLCKTGKFFLLTFNKNVPSFPVSIWIW